MTRLVISSIIGLLLYGCATSSPPPPRRAVQTDPESPAGRATNPDPNLYRLDVAGIRLRDPFLVTMERLSDGRFEVTNQPTTEEIERSSSAQLIAARRVPVAQMPSLAPSEMLVIRYCHGRVSSVQLMTPMSEADISRARTEDTATLPPMRVESSGDRREVRRYNTNSLSGIHLVYALGTRQSQSHPNERSFILSDGNWCVRS